MMRTQVPRSLLDAIRSDLKPVRPLPLPMYRAVKILPLGAALLVGIPVFWTWYLHIAAAPNSAWFISILELAFSVVMLSAGFRESVPGRELSPLHMAALLLAALIVFAVANPAVSQADRVPLATMFRWIGECIGRATIFSMPAVVLPVLLASRGYSNRPALMGALCGLAVGLMGDAGLRLLCWDGDYSHIIVAHGGAIAIVVALGALGALVVDRVKRHRT